MITYSSAIGRTMKMRTSSSSGIVLTGYASRSTGLGNDPLLQPDAGQVVQADPFDQAADVWLGRAQAQGAPTQPQPPSDHRQVDHQRGVGEAQLGQVNDHVLR